MKKLIAMIGAVAMSFGLFADDEPSSLFSISFETAETAKGVDTTAMTFTNLTDSGWAWTPETAFPLSAYATGEVQTLPYGTGDKARRNNAFQGQGENLNYLPLETGTDELVRDVGEGNVVLDQLVKFTGFEDPQTNLVAGTKIAIWMSEFENDDESTETNLFVTVGKVDNLGDVEQIALPIAPITDSTGYTLNTWYRLTVKSLGNIFESAQATARAGFLLYVNGEKVSTTNELAETLIANYTDMTDAAYNCMTNKQLFTAIDDSNATFASVGYKGIGAIDDIILDKEGPGFAVETVDVTFTTISGAIIATVADSEGTVEPNQDGTYSVKPGALTVTLAADEGYKLIGTLTYLASTDDAVEGVINIAAGDTTAELVVATITRGANTLEFAESELDTAISQVQDNDIVTFLAEVTFGEGAYTFTKDTTITVTEGGNWAIYVADDKTSTYECGYAYALAGVMPEKQITVSFENEETGFIMLGGTIYGDGRVDTLVNVLNGTAITLEGFTVGGTLEAEDGEGAILQAAVVAPATIDEESGLTATIALEIGGKVITATELDEASFTLPVGNYKLNIETNTIEETDWYTYSAAQSEPPAPTTDTVTFTVTYDDTQVENVTVKTNGADVVKLGGLAYVVESNAVVTVAATAKAGYQNVTIESDDVTVVDGVFTASEAETEITITAEEIPTPGFKIIISGIDAADVSEDDTSITIATEAKPLVYIGGVAATVGGEAGAWTVTKPEITADTAVSILKGANIPAVGHKWYENATIVGSTAVALSADTDGCAGWNGAMDLAGDYIAAAYGYSTQNLILTTVSDLVNAGDTAVDPIAVVDASTNGGSLRGGAVSAALGVMITGNANSGAIRVYSLDGLTTNLVTTSNGVVPDAFAFDADGQTLWTSGYSPSSARNAIYKYTIKDNLIGDGEKLELAATYEVGERVRGMKKFGDVIIAKTESHWYVMNLADDTPAFTQVAFAGTYSYYDDVEIAGDHFYFLEAHNSAAGVIKVYNLNDAGTWFEGDPIKTISITGDIGCSRCSDSGISFFVTADEETMIITDRRNAQNENLVRAVQWTLPTYDITFAATLNGTLETSVTNGIVAGTTVTVTATPATGYECTQITTNGSAITGTSFDMPAEDVEIGATFALQQFTVAAISVDNASVVATNTVMDTGLVLPATVDYNTAITVTVTPNENYEYKSAPAGWTKNGNGSITTNATVTANLAITVEAPTKKAAEPVDPEVPTHYDTTKEAEDAAKAINDNKATMIKTPTGAVAEDYTALFTAVVKGTDVVVELNQGGTNALEEAAATIETAVANKLGNIAAAAAGGSVEVLVTGVEPGFWYGVAATAELTAMGATEPATWQQATTEGVTLTVTKPATGNAAFFQTRAKVK